MAKNIGIATGGTGGHIFPALQLARQLEKKGFNPIILGVDLDKNQFFPKDEFLFTSVEGANFQSGKLHGVRKILKGTIKSRKVLKKFSISHVIGFGSYYSLPPLLAALYLRIPISLYEPNIFPGKINRALSRVARHNFVHFSNTANCLRSPTSLIEFQINPIKVPTKEEGREKFGLDPYQSTILVFGGSQGASEINGLVIKAMKKFPFPIQVIHITGNETEVANEYKQLPIKAFVATFTKDINYAWAACDLAICRSGAGAIRDQFLYAKPAILIPLRPSSEDHQFINAKFMEEEVKGSYLYDKTMDLGDMIKACLAKEISDKMQEALKSYRYFAKRSAFVEAFENIML